MKSTKKELTFDKKIQELLKEPEKNKFAIVFYRARFADGLGQQEFAELLGCAQGTISKIEAGSMVPNVEVYIAFGKRYSFNLI